MSYAILTPYYGIPLNDGEQFDAPEFSKKLEKLRSKPAKGFVRTYRQGEDSGGAFAVQAGEELTECCNHLEMSELTLDVPSELIDKFTKLYDKLDDVIKKELEPFGEPRLFYLWSSS